MVAYFFAITTLPFYPYKHDSCHAYLDRRHTYNRSEGYHKFKHYGHGLYINTVICLVGWVS